MFFFKKTLWSNSLKRFCISPLKRGSFRTEGFDKNKWIAGKFEWQTGFAAFSYSHSQLDAVVSYIKNQEAHHSRLTFREEYLAFLKRFNVPYNPKYVFDSDAELEP